jgi:hypothetical protein
MIGERSVVIFTCAVLSSLTSFSSSLATESKISQPSDISNQVVVQLNDGQNDRAIYISNNNQAQAQEKFSQKSKELNNPSQQEQTKLINSRWSLVGLSLTSLLFLLVLWILFQPDRRNHRKTTITNISTIDVYNSVTEIDDKIEVFPEEEIDDKIEVFPEQEIIAPEPLPMIGMEYIEEVPPSYQETETLIEASTYRINRDPNNETTISEPFSKPLPKQRLPLTETEGLTSQHERLAASTQAMNKVTIVSAKTTEIDLVFELIQDLQQSDRLLRRKAIWKLTHTGDFRAIEPLVAIIPEADSVDKSLILDAITRIAQRSWQPISNALFISLADENAEVKKNAIRDVTALYKSIFPLTQCLSQMLGDKDQEVQQTAKWALQQFQQQLSLAPVRSQESEKKEIRNKK